MVDRYEIRLLSSINSHKLIRHFLQSYHYKKDSVPRGCKYWFCLIVNNRLRGLAVFGTPAGRNVVTRYGSNTVELRRFVLHPDFNGKNYGSWFMSKCLKKLKQYNIISYCEIDKGFTGALYKACNFKYLGLQRQGSSKVIINGVRMYAQGSKAKKISNSKKTIVYDNKKQIWFYGKRG